MRLSLLLAGPLAVAASIGCALPATAQEARPSVADSFRLGTNTSLFCRVQSRLTDDVLATMFDRAYSIVCRDAAQAVGQVYALRTGPGDSLARVTAGRDMPVGCQSEEEARVEDIGTVSLSRCMLTAEPVAYHVYRWRSGDTEYVAQGLAGYDSALRLALRSIVTDRIVPGELTIATTELGDAAAFARVQAGTLDPDQALSEGYRRNNSGNYAEAAEFFETLLVRMAENDAGDNERTGEYLINRALQQSNLGQFEEAEATYAEALAIPSASPTQLRLRRNFRALHLLNQRDFEGALAVLDEDLSTSMRQGERVEEAVISDDTASEINSGAEFDRRLGGDESERLTVTERGVILDAQAQQLRGAILHQFGRDDEATFNLEAALAAITSVRDGRVRSTARLRAQALSDLAAIAEEAGDFGSAESRLTAAISLMETTYPLSDATAATRARYGAFLARRDRADEALAVFGSIVAEYRENAVTRTAIENRLAPYFALMLDQMEQRPELISDFFLASEILVRPAVANTQSVFARELSGGNDEAARLFRQSITLARSVESLRIEIARLRGSEDPGRHAARIAAAEAELADLQAEQTRTQAALSGFPRYRALSTAALTLEDLQAILEPGEAYFKLSEVAGDVYGIWATRDDARAFRAEIDTETLAARVDDIRESISTLEGRRRVTYPFNVGLSYQLFTEIIGPVAADLAAIDHLIFEPDGAMLRLPLNLLVTDDAALNAYEQRLGTAGNDEYDFRGIRWLGRGRAVSTSLSARGFRDVRNLAPSAASRAYLGFGENAEPPSNLNRASNSATPFATRCRWPLSVWQRPVAADELVAARNAVGQQGSEIVTGPAFNDVAITDRSDLNEFRIIHFATHGLVTQARSSCPPEPSLVTSFAPTETSDGLLTFGDIFDLKLDADLVILSACDTASAAGVTASQEAGVTGGDSALDGLVRAFVGAGTRTVVASHWPVPDDFQATQRLISGMFRAADGGDLGDALLRAQTALMDDAQTSHPYYWSGFAIIGDAGQRVVSAD
ncbi:CHAT domain-containing tetratricopeptide repeat protein [uncultured Parasphingopyxis sp.]|uniref:CHAT domain-containing protein n=1 Tax=uncultured Parasphingopyxis sp. TaxID=1547918 RepID=UPI00261E2E4E|nr:CHAT domain-containing tetratricopeptide repeat protein [uncultured Parasphingopyxis sp.]